MIEYANNKDYFLLTIFKFGVVYAKNLTLAGNLSMIRKSGFRQFFWTTPSWIKKAIFRRTN